MVPPRGQESQGGGRVLKLSLDARGYISTGDCNAITKLMSLAGKTTTTTNRKRCATTGGRYEDVVALQQVVRGQTENRASSLSKTCPFLGQTR
jgi:hypothetical protein